MWTLLAEVRRELNEAQREDAMRLVETQPSSDLAATTKGEETKINACASPHAKCTCNASNARAESAQRPHCK